MADYYPLIARAVTGLEKNTGEARRALYERARTALVTQLRGTTPPLSESEITRERLGLEEAIRKVEAEAAKRVRSETPRPLPERPRSDAAFQPRGPAAPAPPPADEGPRAGNGPSNTEQANPEAAALRAPARNRPPGDRASPRDDRMKGFRDVVAEAEELGNATAQASKSAREAFAAVPSPTPEFERIEPHVEPEGFRPVRAPGPRNEPVLPPGGEREAPANGRGIADEHERTVRPPRSYHGLIKPALIVLVIALIAGIGYWQRDAITGLYQSMRGSSTPPVRETAPATRPKIADRIGPGAQSDTRTQPGQPVAPVAQRVVLYEEDTSDPNGKRYVGSAIWKTENVSPGPGLAPELAVKADIEVPERRLTATFSIRRNTDQALPASHTIEVTFALPADFQPGGIQNVPGVLMKQAEATRGVPLAGLAVKVTTGFFLIGLSAVDGDVQRNIQLLKERAWFDIPVVYNNGRRAILAIEKGTPGERAFEDAFRAWGN
jgi:hypothetical protein